MDKTIDQYNIDSLNRAIKAQLTIRYEKLGNWHSVEFLDQDKLVGGFGSPIMSPDILEALKCVHSAKKSVV